MVFCFFFLHGEEDNDDSTARDLILGLFKAFLASLAFPCGAKQKQMCLLFSGSLQFHSDFLK